MGSAKTHIFSSTQQSFARTAKAISHPARVAIIQHLFHEHTATNKQLNAVTQLSEATVHQHLTVLLRTELIEGAFIGHQHYYKLTSKAVEEVERLKDIWEGSV
ncbi:MAG TPA: winged helix-turn-helix domain-containing protein [Fluviicola sp.]|nr:winged helix-turn-helix domain-containing protein [Fluviicola sp.]